jgi:hypothetical protein
VHIGDRESDIYELFCAAQSAGTHFLVRTCVDRLAGDGMHTVADEMHEVCCKGLHRVETRDRGGSLREAVLELKYRRIHVRPPIGKHRRYPGLSLTVIHAREKDPPSERDGIDWKLVTDLHVGSPHDAIEKLNGYAMRLENRGLSQDPQVRLQGRRLETANGRKAREPDRDPVHPELANLLDDDDEPLDTEWHARTGVHTAGSTGPQ